MLDGNLVMDAARIHYLASQPSGSGVVERILDEESTITLDVLETRFGVEKLTDLQQDESYLLSLLYYFGVLTIVDTDILGKLTLGIPNLVTRALYVDELRQRILPAPKDRLAVANMAEKFYQSADLQPLADYLEQKYFAAFNNLRKLPCNAVMPIWCWSSAPVCASTLPSKTLCWNLNTCH